MTRRPSRREIKEQIDALTADGAPSQSPAIVFEDPDTGEWYDADGDPVSRPDSDGDGPLMIVIQERVVETGWQPRTD